MIESLIKRIKNLINKEPDYCVICGKRIKDYTYVEYDTMVCSRECADKLYELSLGG